MVDTTAKDIPLQDRLLPLTDERLCDNTEVLGSLFLVPSRKTAKENNVSAAMHQVMEKLNKGDTNICREHILPTVLTEEQVA